MFGMDELEAYYIHDIHRFINLVAACEWNIDLQTMDIPFVAQRVTPYWKGGGTYFT